MSTARLLALIAVLACACAPASAHPGDLASAAKSAHRGFLLDPATASTAIAAASPHATKEKSAGGCGASIGRENYLRARYYDPRVGRFPSMDEWVGLPSKPSTLNKYLYGDSDPANHVDPSGHMSLGSLGSTMSSPAVQSTRVVASGFRIFANRAITYTTRTTRLARHHARECFRSRQTCKLTVPILVIGSNFPNAALHIADTQIGRGTNLVSPGLMLTYLKRTKRPWYEGYAECSTTRRLVAMKKFGAPVACDEFPFYATRQGGRENYPARVSLRYIPYIENRTVGVLFAGLVSSSKMKTNDNFLVVVDPSFPYSFFIPYRRR